jgi:CobQ/CobB/MinD/ParA nucleotide binding domain
MQPLKPEISPLALIIASEKGGVRKTATAAALHDFFVAANFDVELVQIDRQGKLDSLFPGRVTTVDMPSTAVMRADDLADARALAPAHDILVSPKPGIRIIDIGANFDRRFFDWAVSTGLDEDCRKLSVDVVGVIPITSDADAVKLGARTAERFGLAFPTSRTLPVICDDGVDITKLHDPDARRTFQRAFAAKVASKDFIRHHRLLPGALAMLEASGLSAMQFAASEPSDLVRATGQHASVVRQVRADVIMYVAAMVEGFAKVFPRAAT